MPRSRKTSAASASCGGVRKHVGEQEVEVRVGSVLLELGWHGVGTEPRRDTASRPDRTQLRELRLAVEAVARLRLERGRAGTEHPPGVALHRCRQPGLARGTGRPHRREDPAAAGVQLLVARTGRAQRELVDPIAREAGVRVAVDQTRDRGQAAPVELLDLAVERPQITHRTDLRDAPVLAEDVGVLDDIHRSKRRPAERSTGSRGRHDLREVANEEPGHGCVAGTEGRSSPLSRASSSASS